MIMLLYTITTRWHILKQTHNKIYENKIKIFQCNFRKYFSCYLLIVLFVMILLPPEPVSLVQLGLRRDVNTVSAQTLLTLIITMIQWGTNHHWLIQAVDDSQWLFSGCISSSFCVWTFFYETMFMPMMSCSLADSIIVKAWLNIKMLIGDCLDYPHTSSHWYEVMISCWCYESKTRFVIWPY